MKNLINTLIEYSLFIQRSNSSLTRNYNIKYTLMKEKVCKYRQPPPTTHNRQRPQLAMFMLERLTLQTNNETLKKLIRVKTCFSTELFFFFSGTLIKKLTLFLILLQKKTLIKYLISIYTLALLSIFLRVL